MESKMLKFLRSEVGVVVSIVVFIFGVIAPYFTIRESIALIQKDIAIINTNHEAHIQDILKNIEEMRHSDSQMDGRLDTQYQLLLAIMAKEGYDISKISKP